MNIQPLVSVSVVNYNGRKFLPDFFESIFQQTYRNIEVIFVDNCSADGSVSFVREKFPQVQIIENIENSGYAEGNNIGFRAAKGEYILVINNDTVLQKNLIEKLVGSFEEIPNLGVVQPMVRLMENSEQLDACGSFWTNTGFNYHYGIYKSAQSPLYQNRFPVYSVKGMCMMMPRSVIERVGLFDPDFWCYFEETDFCHRVWLAGYECWYVPDAFLYHYMGGTSRKKPSSLIQFHSFKNRLCSYVKNLGWREMILVFPIYFFLNILWSLIFLFRLDVQNFFVVYKAFWWNIVHMRRTLAKRKIVQKKIRKKMDREIFLHVRKNPRLSYYLFLSIGLDRYIDDPV